MKKICLLILSLLLVPTVYSQSNDITMRPILEAAGQWVNYIEGELGQEIVRMEYDIISTSKNTFRTLTDDFTYGIFAFGDYRIKDINIKLYKLVNNRWEYIQCDNSSDSAGFIYIKPETTSEYKIVISAQSFTSGHNIGHYGLIIFHELP